HVHIASTEGLGLNADQIHYDAAGQIELGRRLAAAVVEVLRQK
ncbi:MAG: sialate O-acetylesterase, partial [Planctomycetes bacterium]|nr:sialate O-acetylesterase [Planctomycetota bacterium]